MDPSGVVVRILLVTLMLALVSGESFAQAKPAQIQKDKPQGEWKQKPNHWNASAATKEMLLKHGYKVVGAEQFADGNVIYFRRDGGTSVRAIGAVERVVIRPDGETVAIEGAPREVLVDVKAKLGM
jgi:hypothetical protein